MYQQLKAKDERIEEAEDGKANAEAEAKNLHDRLNEADECLKMLE